MSSAFNHGVELGTNKRDYELRHGMRRGPRGKKLKTRSRVTAVGCSKSFNLDSTDDDLRSRPELKGTDSGTIVGCSRPLPALQGSY